MELGGDLGSGVTPPGFGGIPGIDDGGGSSQDTSLESSTRRWVYGLGIGAAWEADVWGRIRSKKAAAQAESDCARGDYEFARQSLAAAVARAYFTTIEACATGCQRTGNTRATTSEASRSSPTCARSRDTRAISISRRSSRAPLPRRTRSTSRRPRARRPFARSKLSPVTTLPAASPRATFLPRSTASRARRSALATPRTPARSDRRRTSFRRRLSSRDEARAARLPRFAISGIGGLGTAQLDGVGTLNAFTWSLAAGITQPIFFGGELKAAQDIRTAEQKAAAASYIGTALRAFEDVENALAGDYYLRKREGALGEMVSSSADSREARPASNSNRARSTCLPSCASPVKTSPRKFELTQSPRLPPARTREPAPRPRRRFQGH